MEFTKLVPENALAIRSCNCKAASEPLLPKVSRCIPVLRSLYRKVRRPCFKALCTKWAILPTENWEKIINIYIFDLLFNKCMLVWHTPSTSFSTHYHTLLNTASSTVWPRPTTLYDQLWRYVGPTMLVNLTPAIVSQQSVGKALEQWSQGGASWRLEPRWRHLP